MNRKVLIFIILSVMLIFACSPQKKDEEVTGEVKRKVVETVYRLPEHFEIQFYTNFNYLTRNGELRVIDSSSGEIVLKIDTKSNFSWYRVNGTDVYFTKVDDNITVTPNLYMCKLDLKTGKWNKLNIFLHSVFEFDPTFTYVCYVLNVSKTKPELSYHLYSLDPILVCENIKTGEKKEFDIRNELPTVPTIIEIAVKDNFFELGFFCDSSTPFRIAKISYPTCEFMWLK